MYGLYVNDKLELISIDLEEIKRMGFILAYRGYKTAYMRLED